MTRFADCLKGAAVAAALAIVAPPSAVAQATMPSVAQATMPAEDRAAIERVVRDYILANPEIVMEAIERLREKQRTAEQTADQSAIAANRAQLFDDPNSVVGGNPGGDVTIVEFFDYRCGVCKRVHPIVEDLVQSDANIRRIYKEWPILGPESVVAARAAIASRKQDKYVVFHNAMMDARATLDEARILQIAASVGLDTRRLRADMTSAETDSILSANYALAENLKLNGTPSFVIGDTLLRGGRDLETLRTIVADARKRR
ncbi:MAG: DsbA family protein [Rhodospirillaceae bacterium]